MEWRLEMCRRSWISKTLIRYTVWFRICGKRAAVRKQVLHKRMRPASVWPIIFTLLLNVVVACAQSTSIHQQIQQTYNFQPHTLSSADITQKSGVLDQFWTNAKSQPNVYIPALRQELADLRNPPFFLYDGSMLLLSLLGYLARPESRAGGNGAK